MLECMRVSIRLPDPLHAAAKELAQRSGRTLSAVIEDALRQWIARRQKVPQAARITLPHDGKGGVMPGVDLSISADLLDIMEGRDESA